jgi:hypothetical protein
MDYPVQYLVKDLKGKTLFVDENKETSLRWAKRLLRNRPPSLGPLMLVQSQFLGYCDEL